MTEFLSMGGYGFYIWTSWLIAFVLMFSLVINSIVKRKKMLNKISQQDARQKLRQGSS